MTDPAERSFGRSSRASDDTESRRTAKRTQCTLPHVVAALTDAADTETNHPVVVQLEAGTPVVLVRTSSAESMVDVESRDGRKYTVFAVDLDDSTDAVLQDENS